MSKRSDEARDFLARIQGTDARILYDLLDEHARMEEVLAVARDFLSRTGAFTASDGYTSYAVGDAEPLRKALTAFDGHETRVPDQPRYEDPDWGGM